MSPIPSFVDVTEGPGDPATRAQLARMIDRYRFAAGHAAGRRVLEVACGTGIGLRSLQRRASLAVGGDIDPAVLRRARGEGGDPPLVRLDAQCLPFRDEAFDVVCLAEALYYLPAADRFFAEAARVLAPGGVVIVTSVNPERWDFIRGAHATRYLAPHALAAHLARVGFDVTLYGSFDTSDGGATGRAIAVLRAIAARLRLVPGTLAGRAVLKRVVYGAMTPLPAVLDDTAIEVPAPVRVHGGDSARFVVTHAGGRRVEGAGT